MRHALETRRRAKHAKRTERDPIAVGFVPHPLLRAGKLQTIVSSYPARRALGWLRGEQVVVLDAGFDKTGYDTNVRLVGYYNRRRTDDASKGLVVSLHGWEGGSHSVYNLILGMRLLDAGFDLFRLNLRDHGPHRHVDPYALNRGIFLGTLIEEAHCAVQRVAAWAGDLPVYLVGPSMGGNFALRIAIRHAGHPVPNLTRVVAISPAINPALATDRIDTQLEFRRYFRRRWLHSMLTKQRLFPELFELDPLNKIPRVRAMTEWLIQRYTDFHDADDYFARYAVLGDALVGVNVPTTILTAADDPVIAVEDFLALTPAPHLDLRIERYGGHVGFVDMWPLRHLLPEMVLAEFGRS